MFRRATLEEKKAKLIDSLAREVSDQRVLDAIRAVPRERFVPDSHRSAAYDDVALSIAAGQTISQPTMVAIMVHSLELRRFDRVLEIGTGSGYQAAILARLAREVTTVERIPALADTARSRLRSLGYTNIRVRLAGRTLGRSADGPYNAIVVSAAAPRLPSDLVDQLEIGGRLVVPVGSLSEQNLMKTIKTPDGISTRSLGACRFVPLIGDGAWSEEEIRRS